MRKYLALLIILLTALGSFAAVPAQAQSTNDDAATSLILPLLQPLATASSSPSAGGRMAILPRGFVYPVAALGNCADKQDCFTYCQKTVNMPACTRFGEDNGLLPQLSHAPVVQRYAQAILAGAAPGNCNSADACVSYCDDSGHADECAVFALTNKLDGRVLGAASGSAALPPSLVSQCGSVNSCLNYCSPRPGDSSCAAFLSNSQQGSYNSDDAYLALHPGPNNCTNTSACTSYCTSDTSTGRLAQCRPYLEYMGYLNPSLEQLLAQQATSQNHPQVAAANTGGDNAYNLPLLSDPVDGSLGPCIDDAQASLGSPNPTTGQYSAAQGELLIQLMTECGQQQQQLQQEQYQQLQQQAGQQAQQQAQQGQDNAATNIQNIRGCLLNALNAREDINRCYQNNLTQ
jgi:hypothetical protein